MSCPAGKIPRLPYCTKPTGKNYCVTLAGEAGIGGGGGKATYPNLPMNDSSQDPDLFQIKRFENEIHRKWNCEIISVSKKPITLQFVPSRCNVSIFELQMRPEDKSPAKQCFAWQTAHVRPELPGNEDITVLDVQVPSDRKDLHNMAVWTWWTDDLVDDKKIVCVVPTTNWPEDELFGLHNQRVIGSDEERGADGSRPPKT